MDTASSCGYRPRARRRGYCLKPKHARDARSATPAPATLFAPKQFIRAHGSCPRFAFDCLLGGQPFGFRPGDQSGDLGAPLECIGKRGAGDGSPV
jgi:hypothetical protein